MKFFVLFALFLLKSVRAQRCGEATIVIDGNGQPYLDGDCLMTPPVLTCNFETMTFDVCITPTEPSLGPDLTFLAKNLRNLLKSRPIFDDQEEKSNQFTCPALTSYCNFQKTGSDRPANFQSISFTDPDKATMSINENGIVTYETVVTITERQLRKPRCEVFIAQTRQVHLLCHANPIPTNEEPVVPPVLETCKLAACEPTYDCNCKLNNDGSQYILTVSPLGQPATTVGWEVAGLSTQCPNGISTFYEKASSPLVQASGPCYTPAGVKPPSAATLNIPIVACVGTQAPLKVNCDVRYCRMTSSGDPKLGLCTHKPYTKS